MLEKPSTTFSNKKDNAKSMVQTTKTKNTLY